jgi:hypothetical protein
MKKLMGLAIMVFVLGCVQENGITSTSIKQNIPIEKLSDDTIYNVEVVYSLGIRESSFNGLRDGIPFKTDTLSSKTFNGTDSGYYYWQQYIGKIYYDTTTCYYGNDGDKWLDTLYFTFYITDVKITNRKKR